MALEKSGIGTSPKSVDSKSKERRKGRDDGSGGAQKKVGHLSDESVPERKRVRRFSGAEPAGTSDLARDGDITGEIDTVAGAGTSRIGAQPIDVGEEEEV